MSVNHTQPDVIRQTECTELRPRRRERGDRMPLITKEQGGKGDSEGEGREKENTLFCDYSTDVTVKMTIVILLHILKLPSV